MAEVNSNQPKQKMELYYKDPKRSLRLNDMNSIETSGRIQNPEYKVTETFSLPLSFVWICCLFCVCGLVSFILTSAWRVSLPLALGKT